MDHTFPETDPSFASHRDLSPAVFGRARHPQMGLGGRRPVPVREISRGGLVPGRPEPGPAGVAACQMCPFSDWPMVFSAVSDWGWPLTTKRQELLLWPSQYITAASLGLACT